MRRALTLAELAAGRRGRVAGVEATSLQALRAWQSAIGIAVRLGVADADGWGRTHRWANPPRDPDLIDGLLEAVEPLVTASDPKSAADVLEAWLQTAGITSPHTNTFDRITQPAIALQPVLDELLSRNGRAHTLIQRRLIGQDGHAIDQRGWDVDDIPQLVWPCALPEHLRESTRPDQRILRAVVSMILVRMGTDARDWVDAGAALGFPADKARNWTRYAFAGRGASRMNSLPLQNAWTIGSRTSPCRPCGVAEVRSSASASTRCVARNHRSAAVPGERGVRAGPKERCRRTATRPPIMKPRDCDLAARQTSQTVARPLLARSFWSGLAQLRGRIESLSRPTGPPRGGRCSGDSRQRRFGSTAAIAHRRGEAGAR